MIKSRSPIQIRSHAQKYLMGLVSKYSRKMEDETEGREDLGELDLPTELSQQSKTEIEEAVLFLFKQAGTKILKDYPYKPIPDKGKLIKILEYMETKGDLFKVIKPHKHKSLGKRTYRKRGKKEMSVNQAAEEQKQEEMPDQAIEQDGNSFLVSLCLNLLGSFSHFNQIIEDINSKSSLLLFQLENYLRGKLDYNIF